MKLPAPLISFGAFFALAIPSFGNAPSGHAREFPALLTPPNAKDVVQVENMPNESPIYIYNTGERKFPGSREEIIRFLTLGQVQPVSEKSGALWDLAPFTPPRPLTAQERNEGGVEFVEAGALSTRSGAVYFWRKLNDRVLYLGQYGKGCYLILPIKKP